MISLFTTYYEEKNPLRKSELDYCIDHNVNSLYIDRIYILNESCENFISPKITSIKICKRPTYNDFFKLVNQETSQDDINIIANSDIYFDSSISIIANKINNNTCFALTRWEDNILPYFYKTDSSQDVWIFKGKVKTVKGNFTIGRWACDNKIAYEIKNAGYKILNPSLSIFAYHLHNSGVRNYQPVLNDFKGPFMSLIPDSFDSGFKIVYDYLTNKNEINSLKIKFRLQKITRPVIKFGIRVNNLFRTKFIKKILLKLYKV
jgi:hypothetical protein